MVSNRAFIGRDRVKGGITLSLARVCPDGRLARAIRVARGLEAADLIMTNGKIVNVFSGEIHEGDVAIADGWIVGIGRYEGNRSVDVDGAFILPGLVEGHIHIESSMLSPREFARAVIPHGTTVVFADPHEIANVLGLSGIDYMISAARALPIDLFLSVPSCVPATGLETAGAQIGAQQVRYFMDLDEVAGLGEVMNFPAVLSGEPDILSKLAESHGKRVDGHAPGLTGRDLNAYILAGIKSDHECTSAEEALEKLRLGMHVMVREGSTARNLRALAPIVGQYSHVRMSLVTDDRHPDELAGAGHLDHLLRRAVALGVDPIAAVQMVTINPAKYFQTHGLGAVAPGYRADLAIVDNLHDFGVLSVYKDGVELARNGRLIAELPDVGVPPLRASVNIGWSDFQGIRIPARPGRIRAIQLVEGQIVTKCALETPSIIGEEAVADPERDLCKLAVIERHFATGRVGLGFVRGLGLKRGAIASTVAHDSHNVVAVGINDDDMMTAVRAVESSEGGVAAAADGQVLAILPLPIAGIMSDRPLDEVCSGLAAVRAAARELGCPLDDPIMTLSFLALPVIPSLKMTDRGLVDVERMAHVGLWEEE